VEGVVKQLDSYRFKQRFDSIFQNINFLQTQEQDTLVLNANFKDHAKVVERINKNNDLWQATNYEEFSKL